VFFLVTPLYKLYDLELKKKFHSRDVVFQEHTFPFHKTSVLPAPADNDSCHDGLFPSLNLQPVHNTTFSPLQGTPTSSIAPVISDSLSSSNTSPSTSSHPALSNDNSLPVSDSSVSSDATHASLGLRRSTRPKLPPPWL